MTKIYVLSSTGNGLKAARELGKNLELVEILSIGHLMKEKKWSIEGEHIGFVFPCYYGTVPQILQRFILEAERVDGSYFFALASAGRSTGNSLKELNQLLLNRKARLHYGENVILKSNYMAGWYYEMVAPKPEVLQKQLDRLEPLCKGMAKDIIDRKEQQGKNSSMNYRLPRLISPTRYVKDTRPWDREFSVSKDCNGCGTCSTVCPVYNIEMKDNRPNFKHNCLRCMGCIQLCPQQAFSILDKPMNKTPYKHPEISLKDLQLFHKEGIARVR